MIKYTVFLFFSLIIFKGNGQNFKGGILLGVCGSQIDGDDQYGYKKPGLVLGAFVIRPFTDKSSLKIETYYIGKGAVKNDELPDGITLQVFNTSLHYVEMPFLFDYKLLPKLNIAIGIAPSYLFAHRLTTFKSTVPKELYEIASFDIQPMGQVEFFLTDHIRSSIRLSYSAFDIRNEELSTWYNNNLGIVFRYEF
jgi:hypothetical protein